MQLDGRGSNEIRAVGNDCDFLCRGMAGEMARDLRMICDQMIGDTSAGPFVKPKPNTRGQRPFLALPVDAVHIHEVGQPAEAIAGIEKAGVVTQRQNDAIFTKRMLDGFPIEVHGSDGTIARGNKNAPYSIPNILTRLFVFFDLAIDGDIVIAGAEKEREILCEGFEPAMSRRYPAGSEYQNVHAVRSWPLPESHLKRRDANYMDARSAVISVKPAETSSSVTIYTTAYPARVPLTRGPDLKATLKARVAVFVLRRAIATMRNMRRTLTILTPFGAQYCRNRLEQNLKVESDTPILDVLQIQSHVGFPGGAVARGHLPKPGQAGSNVEAA